MGEIHHKINSMMSKTLNLDLKLKTVKDSCKV